MINKNTTKLNFVSYFLNDYDDDDEYTPLLF